MSFQNVLFDWDGCLANSLPAWLIALEDALSQRGINAERELIKKGFHDWSVYSDLGVGDIHRFGHEVYDRLGQELGGVTLNEGAAEVIQALRTQGRRLAIVTSTERRNVLPILQRMNLSDHFDCIIDRTDVRNHKPHPEPVETALDRLNGERDSAVMIGDSSVDVLAGRAAGVKTVRFLPPETESFRRHDPFHAVAHFEIQKMRELAPILGI